MTTIGGGSGSEPARSDLGPVGRAGEPEPAAERSALSRAGSAVKDKLVSLAWREIKTERFLSLARVPLGERGALGIRAFEKIVPPSDPLVADDPHRSVYSRERASRHTWLRTGGVVDAGLGLAMPIGPASVGFSANSALEYSVLASYGLGPSGVLDLAKNNTIDLPVTAGNARGMARGAEFSIRGQGAAGMSAQAGAGAAASARYASVALSAGVSGSITASGEMTLNVKRLDGDRVYVRVGKAGALSATAGVAARAGAFANRAAIPEVTLPGGAVTAYIERRAEDALIRKVESVLSAQASASVSASRSSLDVAAFVLDLSKPEGRSAYESLVKLDLGPATRLAAEGRGAARAVYAESSRTRTGGVDARLGPAKLLLIESLRHGRTGKLTTAEGTLDVKSSLFRKSTDGLFAGTRSVSWEGVTLSRDGGAPQTYFHLTFDGKDGATRDEEIAALERFAEGLDGTLAAPARLERDPALLRRIFNGAYGDTRTRLDLYVTPQGLARLAGASRSDVLAAFGRAAQKLEGAARPPAWSDPATARAAEALLRKVRRTFEHSAVAEEYERRFGRSISDDIEDRETANVLAKHVAGMRGKPEAEWSKVFADLGAAARFDLWKHAAALNDLVGADETLIHELSITGERVSIAVRDEGFMGSPDDAIGMALAPP